MTADWWWLLWGFFGPSIFFFFLISGSSVFVVLAQLLLHSGPALETLTVGGSASVSASRFLQPSAKKIRLFLQQISHSVKVKQRLWGRLEKSGGEMLQDAAIGSNK